MASASSLAFDPRIERVEIATGLHTPLGIDKVSHFSDRLWAPIRFREGQSGAREMPEGYFTRHVVSVNVDGPRSVDMWWPGRRYTGHRIDPGRVTVLPAGMPWASRVPAHKVLIVDIEPGFVESVAGRELDKNQLEIHPAFAVEDGLAAHLAASLGAEVRAGGPNGRLYGEGLGTALVAHLLRVHGAVPQRVLAGVRALSSGDLHRVLQYIDDHLETTLSLQRLAHVLRMNLYRFVRAFRQSTGLPPHHYVLQRRIERAKVLLAGDIAIAEIALRLGFADQSHFSTTFRRLTSTTPRRYRDAIR